MTNHHVRFEVPRPKGSLVITRKPFGLRTDGPTNAKQYTPSSLKWGHNNFFILTVYRFYFIYVIDRILNLCRFDTKFIELFE
jgi:hypothetical protein